MGANDCWLDIFFFSFLLFLLAQVIIISVSRPRKRKRKLLVASKVIRISDLDYR